MSMAGAKAKVPAPQLPLSPSYPTEAADDNEDTIHFTFNSKEQAKDWKQYRLGDTEGPGWAIYNGLYHDYAPGMKVGAADDWLVSPPLEINQEGKIDSIEFWNVGFMSRMGDNDTIALYMLTGSRDPREATAREVLLDVRGDNYLSMDQTHLVRKDIAIPQTDGAVYLAFRYLNTKFDEANPPSAQARWPLRSVPTTRRFMSADWRLQPPSASIPSRASCSLRSGRANKSANWT